MDLATLAGSGVAGVLPGYTLSRLHLNAIGQVEAALRARHVRLAREASARLPRVDRDAVVKQATADAAFLIAFDTPAFRRLTNSGPGKVLSLLTAVRIQHPGADERDVRAKIDALPPGECKAAVDWIWGRDIPPEEKRRFTAERPGHWRDEGASIEWEKTFAAVFKRRPSLTYTDVGRMTPEQVMHALKVEDARPNPRDVQFGVLSAVADRLGLSPAGLAKLPLNTIHQACVAELEGEDVPIYMLKTLVPLWAKWMG